MYAEANSFFFMHQNASDSEEAAHVSDYSRSKMPSITLTVLQDAPQPKACCYNPSLPRIERRIAVLFDWRTGLARLLRPLERWKTKAKGARSRLMALSVDVPALRKVR